MSKSPPVIAEMAKDPTLIPGVYNYCDHWCVYCPMKARCLVYGVRQRWEAADGGRSTGAVERAADLTHEAGKRAGRETAELEPILSGTWKQTVAGPRKPHRVQQLAWRYAMQAEAFLVANRWRPSSDETRRRQPAVFDIVAWYHLLIWVKVVRAIDGISSSDGDEADRRFDWQGSAKVALIGIERSTAALEKIEKRGHEGAEDLLKKLAELEPLVESTFPGARSFIRQGLDVVPGA